MVKEYFNVLNISQGEIPFVGIKKNSLISQQKKIVLLTHKQLV